jgi:hypothetical protein
MVILTTPVQMFGDTVDVAAVPPGNFNTVINGDTLAGGVRAHPDRVYRLKHGSVYQVTEALNINGDLHIVADNGTGRPPVLAAAILQDNSSIDHFMTFIGPGAKVEIKNVYILAARADGAALGWSDGIRINADSVQMTLKGDIFDAFSHTAIQGNGQWAKLNVQDCVFRNEMHSTSWFGGGGYLTGAPVAQDTCIFMNNTFFCNNSYNWSIRGYSPYAVFSHNTMVYETVNPFLIRQAQNVHMNNNLYYAVHAMGGNPDHVINGWFLNYPDTASSSIIRFRGTDSVSYWSKLWDATIGGPEAYADPANGVTADMLTADKRVIDVRNNSYYWPTKLTDFYKAYNDTVAIYDSVDVPDYGQPNEVKKYLKRILYMPTWMSEYTKYTLDTLLAGISTITVSNNVEADPGFNTDVQNQLDNLISYVHKISTSALDTPWYYHSSASLYPSGGPVWPLAEDLSYTNADLMHAGTDGFALGDLNWFPTQKAEWEQYITDVNDTKPTAPTKFSLSQNYPNPFNPTTRITFTLEKSGFAQLSVYNILGQKVATLISGNVSAGQHEVNFNATNLSTGVYIYKLESGNNTSIKKMMLLK